MKMNALENERMWFSLLMGFGGEVKVLEPAEVAEMVKEKAREILNDG